MLNLMAGSFSTATAIDLVAAVILVVYTILGLKNGFIKTFFKAFGTILAFIFSALLCSAVANFLESQFELVTKISNWLTGVLTDTFGATLMNTTIEQATSEMLSGQGVASWIIKLILDSQSSIPKDVTLNQVLCPVIGYYITCAIAFIVLFILFKIIFFIVCEIVKSLRKIVLIGIADRLLGLVLGAIQGLIVLDVIIIALGAIPFSFAKDLVASLSDTVFVKFISDTNLVGMIFDFVLNNGANKFLQGLFK